MTLVNETCQKDNQAEVCQLHMHMEWSKSQYIHNFNNILINKIRWIKKLWTFTVLLISCTWIDLYSPVIIGMHFYLLKRY